MSAKKQLKEMSKKAYLQVLRVFQAQGRENNYDREMLVIKMRGELGISDAEHLEMLKEVMEDSKIRDLRESDDRIRVAEDKDRQKQEEIVEPSRKKQKKEVLKAPPPQIKQRAGKQAKESKQKRTPEGTLLDKYHGKQIRIQWEDTWFDAVINDYNLITKEHRVVFDANTERMSFTWIDLIELMKKKELVLQNDKPLIYPSILYKGINIEETKLEMKTCSLERLFEIKEQVSTRIRTLTQELHELEHKGDSQQTHSEESEIDG